MQIETILPVSFQWDDLLEETVAGESGIARIKVQTAGSIKIRKVEYSGDYLADHWCDKGHIVMILSGQLIIDHKDGSTKILTTGTTYVVGDNSMPHKARTTMACTAIIID